MAALPLAAQTMSEVQPAVAAPALMGGRVLRAEVVDSTAELVAPIIVPARFH